MTLPAVIEQTAAPPWTGSLRLVVRPSVFRDEFLELELPAEGQTISEIVGDRRRRAWPNSHRSPLAAGMAILSSISPQNPLRLDGKSRGPLARSPPNVAAAEKSPPLLGAGRDFSKRRLRIGSE
jgi:hypothetical protein